MSKQIAIPQAAAQPLKSGQKQSIKLSKGQHVRVQDLLDGQTKDAANVVATKAGKGLTLKFADGTEVLFDNFYEVCAGNACSVTVAGKGAAGYTITGDSAMGAATQDGGQMVYAYGAQTSLMDMARVDTGVAKALSGLGEGTVSYIPEASGMGVGTVLGVIGGALGVAAAASSGGAGAAVVAGPAHAFISGLFVAGPVVSGNGLIATAYDPKDGHKIAEGTLNADGSFSIDLGVYTGAVLVKVTDTNAAPDYFDEATGAPKDMSTDLRAMTYAPGGGTIKVNVNVFTEVAVGVLQQDGKLTGNQFNGSVDDITNANSKVAAALGLTQNLVSGDAPVAVVNADGSPNNAANAYGKLLAAASGLEQGSNTNESISALLESLATADATSKLLLEGFGKTLDNLKISISLDQQTVMYMINAIQISIDELKLDVSSNTTDIQSLIARATDLETIVNMLNGSVEVDGSVKQQIATAVESLNTAIADLADRLDAAIADLQEQIDTHTGDIADLAGRATDLEAAVNLLNDTELVDGSVKQQIAAAAEVINATIADLADRLDADIADLQSQIDAHTGDIADLAARATDLEAAVNLLNDSASVEGSVKQQIAAAAEVINATIADLADRLDADIADLQSQIDAHAGDIADLAARATDLEAAVNLLNDSASVEGSVKQQIAAAVEVINGTISDLADRLDADIADLQSQIDAHTGDIADLAARATDLEAAVNLLNDSASVEGSVKQQIAAAVDVINGTISDLADRLDADIADLQDQIDAHTGDIADLAGRATDLETAVNLLNDTELVEGSVKQQIKAAVETINSAIDDLTQQLEEAVNDLQGQIDTHTGDIEALAGRATDLEAAVALLNDSASVEGSVLERIATAIGSPSDLENEATGLWVDIEAYVMAIAEDLQAQIDALAGDLTEAAYTTVQALSEQAVILDGIVNGDASVEGTVDYRIAALRSELDARISWLEAHLDVTSPAITDIVISAEGADASGHYGEGDVVTVKVSFEETVLVAGAPTFELMVGEDLVEATLVSGAGTDELVFQYTLTADQYDADGISAGEDALHLNGGSIKDAARNDAIITSDAIADSMDLVVDNGPLSLETSVAQIFGNGLTAENVVIGIGNGAGMYGTYTLDQLDANGNLTLQAGEFFVSIDDYFRYMLWNQMPDLAEFTGPLTFQPDLSGFMALPFPGVPFYIMASTEVLGFFVQMSMNNGDMPYVDVNDYANTEAWLMALGALTADELGGSGVSDLGNVLTQDFLDLVQGHDPADVTLDISGHLTVAQATALQEAGFDLEHNATYTIRDWDTTVSASNMTPNTQAILQGADQVVAMGDELANLMRFTAFNQNVNLRVEAGAGNDQIDMGKGDDEIVGGLGGDTINLTTNDSSYDTVIYQTVRDGQTLPVSSVSFSQNENDYREGAVLTVTVNGKIYQHTVSTEDIQNNPDGYTIQDELEAFAQELTDQLVAIDPSTALVGYLMDWHLNSYSEVTLADLVNGTSYTVPSGHFFVPADIAMAFNMNIMDPYLIYFGSIKGGQCFTLTSEQVFNFNNINEGGLIVASSESVDYWLSDNGYSETSNDLLAVYPGELSGVTAYNGVLTFYGMANETLDVQAGGYDEGYIDAIDNNGLYTSIVVDFSDNLADWPTQTNGDHTTVFDRQLHVTIDGYEVSSDIVYVDGEADMVASIAALKDAILNDANVSSVGDVLISESGYSLTLVGNVIPQYDEQAPTFVVNEAAIDQNGVQQVTQVSFSDNNDDYYDGGYLSVEVGGEIVEVAMVAGDALASVQALVDEVNFRELGSLESAVQNGDSTTIVFTANTEESDPLLVEATLDYQGEHQQATIELMDSSYYDCGYDTPEGAGIYYEGGQVWLSLQTAGADGVLYTDDDAFIDVSADMGSDAASTSQNLVDAINNDDRLTGEFGSVYYDADTGQIVLTSDEFAKESFTINDVTLDYQGVYQNAYVDFSTDNNDYYAGGTLSMTFDATPGNPDDTENNITVTVDMVAGDAEASIYALQSEIQSRIDGGSLEATITINQNTGYDLTYFNPNYVNNGSGGFTGVLTVGAAIFNSSHQSLYSYYAGNYFSEFTCANFGSFVDYLDGLSWLNADIVNGELVLTTDVDLSNPSLNGADHMFFCFNLWDPYTNQGWQGGDMGWVNNDLADILTSAEVNGNGEIVLTSADPEPQQFAVVDANLTSQGVLQEATLTYSQDNADYFEGGTIQAVINGTTISVDMVAGDAQQTLLDLKTAIETWNITAPVSGVGSVSIADGTLTLVADQPAWYNEQIDVGSVSIDVESVTQVTELVFDNLTDDDFFAIDDAGNQGYFSIWIAGVEVTAEMADTKADSLLNMKAMIEDMRDGTNGVLQDSSIFDAVGTVEIIDGELVLTAAHGGVDPLMVDLSQSEIQTPYIDGHIQEISIQFSNTFLDNPSILNETITVTVDGYTSALEVTADVLAGVGAQDQSEYLADLMLSIVLDDNANYGNGQLDHANAYRGSGTNVLYFQSIDRGLDALGEVDASVTKNDGVNNNPVGSILEMINPGVDDIQGSSIILGDYVIINDETGEGFVAVTGADQYTETYDGTNAANMGLDFVEEWVSGVNDEPYSQYIENASCYSCYFNTDCSDWNNGDWASSGVDGGVHQTYTTADHGYVASENGYFEGNAQCYEWYRENGGDASLYGSDPGYYTKDGLVTTWLNGGTQTDTDFYGVNGDGNPSEHIVIGDGSQIDDGGEAGQAVDPWTDTSSGDDMLAVWTEDNGFAAYCWDNSYLSIHSTGNDQPDTINGFQVGNWTVDDTFKGDQIALEGTLLETTVVDYVDYVDACYYTEVFDLSTDEFGLVDSQFSTLDHNQIRDSKAVANLLSGVFEFDVTTDNGEINTSVFAVTAQDDPTTTAIWVHQQSTSWDSTVDSFELSLLAVLHTTGQEFNAYNFAQVNEQVFPV